MRFIPYLKEYRELMPREAQPLHCEDTTGIVAVRGDDVQAICVLDSFNATLCEIHIWIKNAMVLKHGFAEEIFRFVFDSGRFKIIGKTPADNEQALKFIKHIGFKEIFRVQDGHKPGIDLVVTEIHRDSCRYYHGL